MPIESASLNGLPRLFDFSPVLNTPSQSKRKDWIVESRAVTNSVEGQSTAPCDSISSLIFIDFISSISKLQCSLFFACLPNIILVNSLFFRFDTFSFWSIIFSLKKIKYRQLNNNFRSISHSVHFTQTINCGK